MTERLTVVDPDGRRKAYRPLPSSERATALRAGLDAYEHGDFFEAHERLEPAWMGTDDRAERSMIQALIKVSAAYVHDARGNPAGITRNLEGARARLQDAIDGDTDGAGLDARRLLDDIDDRLRDLEMNSDRPTLGPPTLHRSAR